MNITVNGQKISLTQKEYLTQGGQGDIYVKDGIVYKIYIEPSKMIPLQKIKELSILDNPFIIKPEQLICNNKQIIGYTMPFIDNTYTLCELFTKAFRLREGLQFDQSLDLVLKLKKINEIVHSKKILIVDENELNFLVSKSFDKIYAIDVDNWQTPSFPAQVIMENIRDPSANSFSELTDWYAFAILSFQMMVGIHPFKGKHPAIKSWQERMQKNISVFSPDVALPINAYSLDLIPENYKSWYKSIFDDGKRSPPPDSFIGQCIVQAFAKEILSNKVGADLIFSCPENISQAEDCEIGQLYRDKSNFYWLGKIYPRSHGETGTISLKNKFLISAKLIQNKLILNNLSSGIEIQSNITAEQIKTFDNKLFIKNNVGIHEVQFIEVGVGIFPTLKKIVNTTTQGTKLFSGAMSYDVLGSMYVTVFSKNGSYLNKISELDNYRIIDAKYQNNVFIVLGINKSTKEYDKIIIRFNEELNHYDVRYIYNVDKHDVDFIVLDTGICVHHFDDEKIEMFKNINNNPHVKILEDKIFDGVFLSKMNTSLLLIRDNKVFKAKIK